MIAAAEQILAHPAFEKPTILMLVDRNELESQLFANLTAYGLPYEHATSKARLRELLRADYRGLIVSMIHKFDRVDADLCPRPNGFVFVDDAHRTTIVHELLHLLVPNHGKLFKSLMTAYVPGWEQVSRARASRTCGRGASPLEA